MYACVCVCVRVCVCVCVCVRMGLRQYMARFAKERGHVSVVPSKSGFVEQKLFTMMSLTKRYLCRLVYIPVRNHAIYVIYYARASHSSESRGVICE
jgi:hypothetical protein